MATNLDQLIAKLQASNAAYTPLTQEQMQQQAENRYASTYDQHRLTAQQQYDTNAQALAQQLAGLQATYDKQREQSAENYRQYRSQADRQALSRGMQRSSYNNATLANIDIAGGKAQQAINDTEAAQRGNIGEQQRLLSSQLAAQLAQYNTAQQQDILAYIDQLEAREYDRTTANQNVQNQLALQIYEYQHQLEQEAEDARRWNAEFAAQYGGGSGSSRGGGGSSGGNSKKNNQNLLGLKAAFGIARLNAARANRGSSSPSTSTSSNTTNYDRLMSSFN